ncbi:hypothetical protein ABZY44_08535 [Streptomyces sp. NPDC006544]|uniref:hypothetical protein n=1 Tax=Streptomyces sp. NPDC006544 TaxID=3154583 RepID=UPI0033B37E3C
MRDALSDWRQDAVLIGVLPVLCWPAFIGALVTRPAPLKVVLFGLLALPVLVALRELHAVRCVRRVLGAPGARWTRYEAEVLAGRGPAPLLVLGPGPGPEAGADEDEDGRKNGTGIVNGDGDGDGDGEGGGDGPVEGQGQGEGDGGREGRFVLTLGPLGRRVLTPRAWFRTDPAVPQSARPPSSAEPDGDRDPAAKRAVWLMGAPGRGAVLWEPHTRELGWARRLWRRPFG